MIPFLLLFMTLFLSACGSDPSRPGMEPSIPVQVGVIQPDLSGFLSYPTDIIVAPDGAVFVKTSRGISRLAENGDVVQEIPIPREDGHFGGYGWNFAVTADRIIVQFNISRKVRVMDRAGVLIREFTFESVAVIEHFDFYYFDMAAARDGTVYVLDAPLRRIQKFSPDGVLEKIWGERGIGPGEMEEPRQIVLDSHDNPYVLDEDLWRVTKFSPDGAFLNRWDMIHTIQFGGPLRGLLAVDSSGRPAVVDRSAEADPPQMTIFGASSGVDRQWRFPVDENQEFVVPEGFAVTPEGDFLFTDSFNRQIVRYSAAGTELARIGHRYGLEEGEIYSVSGITGGAGGQITLFDSYRGSIMTYDSAGRFLRSLPISVDDAHRHSVSFSRVKQDAEGSFWARSGVGPSIVRFSPRGVQLSAINLGDAAGPGNVTLGFRLLDVEVAADGLLHTLETIEDGYRVGVWTPGGVLRSSRTVPRDRGKRIIGDLALDAFGTAWILDTDDRLLWIDSSGAIMESVAWAVRSAGLDMEIRGIAWSPSGQLFVVDQKNFRVVVLDRLMNYRGEFRPTEPADPDADLFRPTDDFGRSFSLTRDGSFLVATTQRSAAIFR